MSTIPPPKFPREHTRMFSFQLDDIFLLEEKRERERRSKKMGKK
jgi:hypothetical protein